MRAARGAAPRPAHAALRVNAGLAPLEALLAGGSAAASPLATVDAETKNIFVQEGKVASTREVSGGWCEAEGVGLGEFVRIGVGVVGGSRGCGLGVSRRSTELVKGQNAMRCWFDLP